VEIEFQNTPDDLIALNRLYVSRQPVWRRWVIRVAGLIAAAMLVIFVVFSFVHQTRFDLVLSIQMIGVPVALVAVLVLSSDVFASWRIRRNCRNEPLARQLAEKRRLVIAPAGVTVSSPSESTTRSWTEIAEVIDTADRIFLCLAAETGAIVIPRACFHSDDHRRDFLECLRHCQTEGGRLPAESND
jgi:YcxB-like protein